MIEIDDWGAASMRHSKSLRLLLHLLQLLLLISLIGATATQTWSSIAFEVQATDGAPTGFRENCCTPFGIGAELNISQNSSDVGLSLAGPSAMAYWQSKRVNEVVITQDEEEREELWGNNSYNLSEVQTGLPQGVKIVTAISAVVLFIHLLGYQRRWIPGLILNFALFALIVAFVIMPTLGWFGGGFDVESKGTGGGSLDLEHEQIITDFNLSSESLDFLFNVSGFDLAMANESEQQHISTNLTSADVDHMAFIAFDGSFSITFTPLVQDLMMIWLVVFTLMPLALIVIERVEIDLPSRLEE